MAKDARPEYFYHPVVGGLSPAMLGVYLSHASFPSTVEDKTIRRTPMTLQKTATCMVTGEVLPIAQMIRFVISPNHTIIADLTQKLPGVFVWVSADRGILKKAIWRNSFAGTTRQNVQIPDNLLESIETGLARLSMQTLSMAKRAGELCFGFTKVDEALRSHTAAVYVVASDAKENGREKLERLAIFQNLPVLDNWSSAELSAAIGEENVIHVALATGGLTQKLLELLTKLKAVKSET
jgi:predicted RNA-binding protein YlxR (DUF448 family)